MLRRNGWGGRAREIQRGEWGGALPRAPAHCRKWIPAPKDGFLLPVSTRTSFAGMTVGDVVVPALSGKRVPEGGMGRGLPRVPGMDSCLRRNGCYNGVAAHALTTPARSGSRGLPFLHPPLPVRGEHVEPHERAGCFPFTPFDKLRMNGWGRRAWVGMGPPPRPRDGFLPRFHEDKLRRNDGWGVVVPAKAGTQRGEWGGASPASQGWIPAFAGMVAIMG